MSELFDQFDRQLEALRRSRQASSLASSRTPVQPVNYAIGGDFWVTTESSDAAIVVSEDLEEEEEIEEDEDDLPGDGGELIIQQQPVSKPASSLDDYTDRSKYYDPSLPYECKLSTELGKMIFACLKEVFPEHLFDVADIKNGVHATILYQDIDVHAGTRKHNINDLFVKVYFREDGTINGTFHGTRGIATPAEVLSDYSHSHLPNLLLGTYHHFCTGTDSIIDSIRNLKGMLQSRDEYRKRLIGFFHHLSYFVTQESLIGVPYRKIENIGISRNSEVDDDVCGIESRKIVRELANVYYVPRFSMNWFKTRIILLDTDDYESMLAGFCPKTYLQQKNQYGMFYSPGSDGSGQEKTIIQKMASRRDIAFRGQVFSPVLDLKKKVETDTGKYCHREIKQAVDNTIKNLIFYELIERRRIKNKEADSAHASKEGQNKNHSGISLQDIVIVPED